MKTKFLSIDSVTRPNAEKITDLSLSMLNEKLKWVPPINILQESDETCIPPAEAPLSNEFSSDDDEDGLRGDQLPGLTSYDSDQ